MPSETVSKTAPWWWFSFVGDEDHAEPGQFLGACIIQAITAHKALVVTHQLKLNPGGAVECEPFPANLAPPPEYRNRLLTLAECETLRELLTAQLQAPPIH